MTNKQIYTVAIKKLQSFTLAISNFSTATGLFLNIKSLFIKLNTTLSSLVSVAFILNIKNKLSIVSNALLNSNTALGIRYVRLVNVGSALYNVSIVDNERIQLILKYSGLQAIFTTITHLFVRMSMTPTLAIFYTLGTYDPNALSTMDSSALSTLISS